MPNWKEVLEEIQQESSNKNPFPLDTIRRKYLAKIFQHTGRNVIAYYSSWLKGRNPVEAELQQQE